MYKQSFVKQFYLVYAIYVRGGRTCDDGILLAARGCGWRLDAMSRRKTSGIGHLVHSILGTSKTSHAAIASFPLPLPARSRPRAGEWCAHPHLVPTSFIRLTLQTQAHRIVIQVAVTGARILGRAVAESWRQAQASQRYAAAAAKNPGAAKNLASSGLTLDEACKILDVAPPKGGQTDMEHVLGRFKRLFDQNDPKKGGSFYLQSKILRARERIELEVRTAEEAAAKEKEMKEGWKPKVYKDR